MSPPILTIRQLNRATLARQMLVEREPIGVVDAIERLGGLQAQLPIAPYIGLWTRLQGFHRDDLARLIENRTVVKATFHRATLHLVTGEDYVRFRSTLKHMLEAGWAAIAKGRGEVDLESVLSAARAYIAEKPRTFAEISEMLAERWPEHDVGAMRYGVRTHLPLAQVPGAGRWSFPGNPAFALAEEWLGRNVSPDMKLEALVFRYLGAFGPASIRDMQTWSGLTNLKETFEQMRPDLQVFRDENRRELFDLPTAPRHDPDIPVAPRFLPEYDNLLLSHNVRSRVIADEYRSRVYLPGLRVRATFLIDGFVRGAWRIENKSKEAVLTVEPFDETGGPDRDLLLEEAERLARFVEPEATSYHIRCV